MTLANWLERALPELKSIGISYGADDPVPFPYITRLLVAALLNKNGSDCVFVIPQAEVVACLASLFSALSNTKHSFAECREEFAKDGLKRGQKVRLIPNNTIYEYGGFLEAYDEKFFRLNLLGAQANKGCVSLPLQDILRLFPTSRSQPKGGPSTKAVTELSELDKVIDIESYGNYSLFKNRIILHCSKGKMESFLEMWSMHRRDSAGRITASLLDMRDFPWGWVNRDGALQSFNRYQLCGEPVIAFCNHLSSIDEYCSAQPKNSRTIITSNKKAVLDNAYETESLCDQHKFFLFTEEIDAEETLELKDLGFSVWKLSREEIFLGIDDEESLEKIKKLAPLRMIYGAAGGDKSSVKIHEADSPVLRDVERKIVEVSRRIPDPEINSLTVQPLKRIYWRSLELLGSPEKKYQDWLLDQALSVDTVLKKQTAFIGTENIEQFQSIMSSIMDDFLPSISLHSQNKFDLLQNAIRAHRGQNILLLCRHAEALETLKKRLHDGFDATFLTYNEIAVVNNVYDIAIMAGWPGKHLFSKLFYSGVADKIEAVLYQNEISAFTSYFKLKAKAEESARLTAEQKAEIIGCPADLFNECEPTPFVETQLNKVGNADIPDIESKERAAIFNVDWSIRPKLPSVSDEQSEQMIDACYVSFNNDRCAFLANNHRVAVIDPRTFQFKNKSANELSAGDIIVFRQSGDREILKEIAERIYPESYSSLELLSSEWKLWLGELGNTASDIWLTLSEHGLQRNIMTVTNWVRNEDLIGPQNLKDILVIAKATGSEENVKKAEEVANAVKAIRGMHVEAGFKLTKILMSHLSKELNENTEQDHDSIHTSLADVELMTVEEVDINSVKVLPALANAPHPIWWFDTLASIDVDELLQDVRVGNGKSYTQ